MQVVSCVACYFMCQNGDMFKSKVAFAPYFYLQIADGREMEVEALLRRKHEGALPLQNPQGFFDRFVRVNGSVRVRPSCVDLR